jgi:hypothetical protein
VLFGRARRRLSENRCPSAALIGRSATGRCSATWPTAGCTARSKRLTQAGWFVGHHALPCRLLVDQIDHLDSVIEHLSARVHKALELVRRFKQRLVTIDGVGTAPPNDHCRDRWGHEPLHLTPAAGVLGRAPALGRRQGSSGRAWACGHCRVWPRWQRWAVRRGWLSSTKNSADAVIDDAGRRYQTGACALRVVRLYGPEAASG